MRLFSSIYLLLLIYIITAILFWETSLQKQSGRIYAQEMLTLQSQIDSTRFPQYYEHLKGELQVGLRRRTFQYIAEGSTFLIVIIIGAGVVYRSFRRTMALSNQQNNFILSVTHELKSPIAAMKLNMQTLARHKLDEDNKSLLINRSIAEANRLNELCNNILYTAQMDDLQYKPLREPIDLSSLTTDIAQAYASRYPERIKAHIAPNLHTTGDPTMLQLMLTNLIENALKYSNGTVTVSLQPTQDPKYLLITVADSGQGIADKDKKQIFNKFYRLGNENSRQTQGTGLGLYLVKKIVQHHKGKINLKDNTPTGAIFEIWVHGRRES